MRKNQGGYVLLSMVIAMIGILTTAAVHRWKINASRNYEAQYYKVADAVASIQHGMYRYFIAECGANSGAVSQITYAEVISDGWADRKADYNPGYAFDLQINQAGITTSSFQTGNRTIATGGTSFSVQITIDEEKQAVTILRGLDENYLSSNSISSSGAAGPWVITSIQSVGYYTDTEDMINDTIYNGNYVCG